MALMRGFTRSARAIASSSSSAAVTWRLCTRAASPSPSSEPYSGIAILACYRKSAPPSRAAPLPLTVDVLHGLLGIAAAGGHALGGDGVDAAEIVRGERDGGGGQVLLEVLAVGRAGDRHHVR